jgi:yecA family protein
VTGALHEAVEQALAALECDVGAAECHGMLCGMLCGPGEFDERMWLAHVTGDAEDIPDLPASATGTLLELAGETRDALERDDFGFALLLPPDGAPLGERAAAFGAWCRGYLSGLGLSGIADLAVLGEDARSFVRDVERLSAIDEDAAGDEEDERALVELTEFARVGVLVVHSDARVLPDQSREPGSIH